jgi:hypothetical protein
MDYILMKSRIFIPVLLALGLWSSSLQAQMLKTIVDFGPPRAAPSYSGPGNVVTGAVAWWGLRGYNAAYSGNVAQICDSATGLVCATVTWTAAGGLSVPLIGGIACNNTTAICVIATLYDQSGAGSCLGACNLTQATNANRPIFVVPGASNGCTSAASYCMKFATSDVLTNTAGISQFQPFTVSAVVERTSVFTTENDFLLTTSSGFVANGFSSSANTVVAYAGSTATATANDSTPHAIQTIFNGSSTLFYVDGVASPTGNAGGDALSGTIQVGEGNGGNYLNGILTEVGAWVIGFSSGQQSSMNSNQHTYWGF